MSIKKTVVRKIVAVAALAVAAAASPASASNYTYMTGSSNPWSQTTEDTSMDLAFGVGNWTKVNGFSTSVFSSPQSLIYIDGGDGISAEFNAFVSANLSTITSYVASGGHVLINAARWDQPDLNTGFGTSLTAGYSSTGALTADGIAAGLGGLGAGNSWTGDWFSHDVASGVTTCYVTGSAGCVFGTVGNGLYLGGQTAPYYQSTGGSQLFANELKLAAGSVPSAVPEPSTWALMLMGFGMVGAALRRKIVGAGKLAHA